MDHKSYFAGLALKHAIEAINPEFNASTKEMSKDQLSSVSAICWQIAESLVDNAPEDVKAYWSDETPLSAGDEGEEDSQKLSPPGFHVYAPKSGTFKAILPVGAKVQRGDLLGEVIHPGEVSPLKSPCNGTISYLVYSPSGVDGEPLEEVGPCREGDLLAIISDD